MAFVIFVVKYVLFSASRFFMGHQRTWEGGLLQRRGFSGRFYDDFPGTTGLLLVIVGFYLLETILQQNLPDMEEAGFNIWVIHFDVIYTLGSCKLEEVLDGQVWRIVAAVFLHAGFLHILFNGWVLTDLGRVCEPLLGTERFLVVYVTTGITGSLASLGYKYVTVGPEQAGGSVGASGALFGLIGLLLAYSIRHRDRTLRNQLVQWIVYIVIFSVVFSGFLDHAGHIGGFLGGAVFGYFVPSYVTSRATRLWRIPCWIAVAICVVALGMAVWNQFELVAD